VNSSKDRTVEIEAYCLHATDAALLVEVDGEEIWIPKSQIDLSVSEVTGVGDRGTLVITRWIAQKKNLI